MPFTIPPLSPYAQAVHDYLTLIGAAYEIAPMEVQCCPIWCPECGKTKYAGTKVAHAHGYQYQIKLVRSRNVLTLDNFWNSQDSRYRIRSIKGFTDTIGENSPSSHLAKPSAYSILGAFINDSTAELSTFEEWCSDLGYDTDSRRAERAYNDCIQTAIKLKRFFSLEEVKKLFELTQ